MIGRTLSALAVSASLAVAAPPPVYAQDAPPCSFGGSEEELLERASPPDSSSVVLDGTVAKICYSSPRKRGREIFGGLVPLGQPWRLGANEPTTLHVTGPVRVGDVELEAGSYSVYAVPGEESWTIVLNAATERWGIPISEAVREHDVGAVSVTPAAVDETVEETTLTLSAAAETEGRLTMAWDDTRWSLPIRAARAGGDGEE